MAAKGYSTFVTDVANAVDDRETAISSDPQVRSIFAGVEPYQERVTRAVSYWKGRVGYRDPNQGLFDKLKQAKEEREAKEFGDAIFRGLGLGTKDDDEAK